MARQPSYVEIQTQVEGAFGLPDGCLPAVRSMANALIQDALQGEVKLPVVLEEAAGYGEDHMAIHAGETPPI